MPPGNGSKNLWGLADSTVGVNFKQRKSKPLSNLDAVLKSDNQRIGDAYE